MSVSVCL